MTARRHAGHRIEETIVEMTWIETCQLLGIDLLIVLLLVVAAVDRIGHAVHSTSRPDHRHR